jgi:hypothetical protein
MRIHRSVKMARVAVRCGGEQSETERRMRKSGCWDSRLTQRRRAQNGRRAVESLVIIVKKKVSPGCYVQYTDCKRETDLWLSCTLRSSCTCVRVGVRQRKAKDRHTQKQERVSPADRRSEARCSSREHEPRLRQHRLFCYSNVQLVITMLQYHL